MLMLRCPSLGRGRPRNKFDFSEVTLTKQDSSGRRASNTIDAVPMCFSDYVKYYTGEQVLDGKMIASWRRVLLEYMKIKQTLCVFSVRLC